MQDAAAIIGTALREHPGAPCLTCSFQAEDMVVLHMLRAVTPDIPVLFLETGYHFPETYAYRDRMAREWDLRVINLHAADTVAEHESVFGKLYASQPDRCCKLRKVEPLLAGLELYDVWFTGLRREQSPTRAGLQFVESQTLPTGKRLAKVSPLADWTWDDVWAYMAAHQIPALPLYKKGYTSIGCQPCTSLPLTPGDLRSGRWSGRKQECGIHTFGQGG
jgi:phosphoadenosine phosphosulfate reductase